MLLIVYVGGAELDLKVILIIIIAHLPSFKGGAFSNTVKRGNRCTFYYYNQSAFSYH